MKTNNIKTGLALVAFILFGTFYAAETIIHPTKLKPQWSFWNRNKEEGLYPLAVSNDGNKIAAVNGYGWPRIHIWDMKTQRECKSKELPRYPRTIVFSPDNSKLALRDEAGLITILDANTAQELITFASGKGFCLQGLLLFSADSQKIIVNNHNDIDIYECSTGKKLHTLTDHENWVVELTLNNNGSLLISRAENDTYIRVWDVETGLLLGSFGGRYLTKYEGLPTLQCACSGGDYIAVSTNHHIFLWSLSSKAIIQVFRANNHQGYIKYLAFSRDNTLLIAGSSSDGKIQAWDIESGNQLFCITNSYDPTGFFPYDYPGLFYINDKNNLICIHDKQLCIYDIYTGAKIATLKDGERGSKYCVVFADTMVAAVYYGWQSSNQKYLYAWRLAL